MLILALSALVSGCTQSNTSGGATATSSPAAVASTAASPAVAASESADASGLRPIDKSALASLVASGGNLTCGHDIENEIEVPTVADGNAIASSLSQDTYFVRVAQKADGPGALAIVETHVVPSDANIVAMVAKMNEIARAHHGKYSRWETEPIKSCP